MAPPASSASASGRAKASPTIESDMTRSLAASSQVPTGSKRSVVADITNGRPPSNVMKAAHWAAPCINGATVIEPAAAAVRARHPELVAAQLAPRPPVSAGVVAALAGATAMLDVSDGLARDARRMAEDSGVGIDFRRDALGADPLTALAGAEDHGLLAAFPSDAAPPHPFEVIGTATADAGRLTLDGEPVDTRGWDPYAGWDGVSG